jgi:hypothetical protein
LSAPVLVALGLFFLCLVASYIALLSAAHYTLFV